MSVGGKVTRTVKIPDGDIRIYTMEPSNPNSTDTCVNVADTEQTRCIEAGDSLWWQGDRCYWTPKSAKSDRESDIPIKRTSCSYEDPDARLIKRTMKQETEP